MYLGHDLVLQSPAGIRQERLEVFGLAFSRAGIEQAHIEEKRGSDPALNGPSDRVHHFFDEFSAPDQRHQQLSAHLIILKINRAVGWAIVFTCHGRAIRNCVIDSQAPGGTPDTGNSHKSAQMGAANAMHLVLHLGQQVGTDLILRSPIPWGCGHQPERI